MVDGADVEVVLELLEGLFDLGEDNVLLPEFFGLVGDEVGSQQVGAFAPAGFAQLVAVEAEDEGAGVDGVVFAWEVFYLTYEIPLFFVVFINCHCL